jgi:very-short-patch-repair endonuclease
MSKKKTIEDFVDEAKLIHGFNYDYSKVLYVDAKTDVEIVCLIHGSFLQSPDSHLSGKGCLKCGVETSATKRRKTIKDFVCNAKVVHGERYDYSISTYVNSNEKLAINCSLHGVFWQLPGHHLRGVGCPVCGANRAADNKKNKAKALFESTANKVHGGRYDYSYVNYISAHGKVEIACRRHGIFKQDAASHLGGKGCPICMESKGECLVASVLDSLGVRYVRQKKFDGCRLERQLSFDFYLPDFNVAIEFDGIQHYEPRDFGGSKESACKEFMKTKKRDEVKNDYCKEAGIELLRVNFICRDTVEERIRGVIYAKNRITAQTLGDETEDMVLRRLGPKDLARLL